MDNEGVLNLSLKKQQRCNSTDQQSIQKLCSHEVKQRSIELHKAEMSNAESARVSQIPESTITGWNKDAVPCSSGSPISRAPEVIELSDSSNEYPVVVDVDDKESEKAVKWNSQVNDIYHKPQTVNPARSMGKTKGSPKRIKDVSKEWVQLLEKAMKQKDNRKSITQDQQERKRVSESNSDKTFNVSQESSNLQQHNQYPNYTVALNPNWQQLMQNMIPNYYGSEELNEQQQHLLQQITSTSNPIVLQQWHRYQQMFAGMQASPNQQQSVQQLVNVDEPGNENMNIPSKTQNNANLKRKRKSKVDASPASELDEYFDSDHFMLHDWLLLQQQVIGERILADYESRSNSLLVD